MSNPQISGTFSLKEVLLQNKALKDSRFCLVAYPDGGASPNPGASGYGVHGYFYELNAKDAKPTLVQNHFKKNRTEEKNKTYYCVTTNKGYEECHTNGDLLYKTGSTHVKPVAYLDIADHFNGIETNNVAELHGMLQIFRTVALNEEVDAVCIVPDSKYAKDTMETYVTGWKRNNWLKSDGTPPKNLDLIQELDHYQESLKKRGCKIEYLWVRGHNENIGNSMADYFASIAVNAAQEYLSNGIVDMRRPKMLEQISPEKNYWTRDPNRHPFLHFKRAYFNRVLEKNEPGHYFLIEPADDDAMIGKRANEAYAVVRLNTPCEMMENVIQAQGMFGQDENRVVLALMERVYSKFVSKFSDWFGKKAFFGSANKREVLFRDFAPVALEHNPPLLIYRSSEILLHLDSLLDEFMKETGRSMADMEDDSAPYLKPTIEDITDEFYLVEEKNAGGKVTRKVTLKSEFVTGYKNHIFHKERIINGRSVKLKFPMSLGMDLPNRNQLKRLESDLPNIYLLTWNDSDVSLRYAFVVDCVSGVGVWSNYFCDRIFLPV